MAFAQRHPEVFDGIVAGAPGFSLPRAAVAEAWDTQAFASLIEAGTRRVQVAAEAAGDLQQRAVRARTQRGARGL